MSIEWKTMSLEDKEIVRPYYEYEQSSSCEVAFANNILWAPFYEVEYAIVEGMLVFLTKKICTDTSLRVSIFRIMFMSERFMSE